MQINHNIAALNTYNRLNSASNAQSKSMEKLSSGMRINRAGDDAAGLAISEKMRGQIRGLDMAAKNSQDATSMIQTAEGALNETHSILQRMRELTVQGANDTNVGQDRDAIQEELNELKNEIDRIGNTTEFNKQTLLNGGLGGTVDQDAATTTALGVTGVSTVQTNGAAADTYTISVDSAGKLTMSNSTGTKSQTIANADGAQELNFSEFGITIKTNAGYTADALDTMAVKVNSGSVTFQIGANEDQNLSLNIRNMKTDGVLDLAAAGKVDVSSHDAAKASITNIDKAITEVSKERSKLGAYQNRLEHTINNLTTSSENLTAAESRIRDVDYALAA
ncbi:flagellin [Heyndrickxia sporothermodurans]|uniref:flagellin N-terminal helical domain-containing protein n=1 Tax=Heyndrickxia sporothermodurans TaxID=46224 RepID=UPI002E1B44C2|nr:flagellin [Heyndrickxia sporothermodurans]MED3650575.1 flagellin [Heyndrickxia sporothermodurans]MED3653707.1 flagellin [Heyndrickxia sporothermodurans]MED3697339.1 flagellin [Heyndrickxia sporothermodurans]MED3780778.1 flagellin [Heyndrickxia sporothermodurans]